MTTKTYNGIRTGFGCKVDEDLHGGPGGSILVAYYECNSIAEAATTAIELLDSFYEVTIFSERGTNALADDDTLTQARADIEAARQQAAEAGLPFSERLVDGPEDELNPYIYDGSMTPEDYEATQRARDAHTALVEVVADHYPNATEEAVERVAEAASSMKLSPEAAQRILNAFDNIIEAINRMIEWAAQAIRTLADFFSETLDDFILRRAPPKWRHYALHAKRARVRKKYRNRIRRAFFAALASEGGGSS